MDDYEYDLFWRARMTGQPPLTPDVPPEYAEHQRIRDDTDPIVAAIYAAYGENQPWLDTLDDIRDL